PHGSPGPGQVSLCPSDENILTSKTESKKNPPEGPTYRDTGVGEPAMPRPPARQRVSIQKGEMPCSESRPTPGRKAPPTKSFAVPSMAIFTSCSFRWEVLGATQT